MNILDALKEELNIEDNLSQESQVLSILESKYLLFKREQYQILLKDGFKTYHYSTTYEDYELDMEHYFSIVTGSWLDENYKGLSILVETVTLGVSDYPTASFELYRLDGIIERKTINYNNDEQNLDFVKKLKKV